VRVRCRTRTSAGSPGFAPGPGPDRAQGALPGEPTARAISFSEPDAVVPDDAVTSYDNLPHGGPRRLEPGEVRSLVALLALNGPRQ